MKVYCFVVVLLIFSAFVGVSAQDVHSLVKQQFGIEHQLQVTKSRLNRIQRSKEIFEGLKQASEIINATEVTPVGVSSDELSNISTLASENFNEISLFEAELKLRAAILEKSLVLLRLNMSMNGFSSTNIKRFASNNFGTVYLTGNGTLLYVGRVGNTQGTQGYTSTVYDSTSDVLKYPTRVNTSLIGDSIVTGVYAMESNFVIKTSKNKIFTWGVNSDASAGVSSSGRLVIMREINFGTSDPFIIKSVKCDVASCIMLTEDGRLFYWGYYLSCWSSSSCPVPTMPSGLYGQQVAINPINLKVVVNSTERRVHDFASTTTTLYMNSICVILQVSRDIYCVGSNTLGQLGEPSAPSVVTQNGGSRTWLDYECHGQEQESLEHLQRLLEEEQLLFMQLM